jgi:hydroxyethylthiazole kinase-like uncharacterized protein yjeF
MTAYDITISANEPIVPMIENHTKLYTSAQAKMLDLQAMEIDKLKDGELMERAGEAAYRHLWFLWPRAHRITVVCGPGNNGGDGYVLARKLLEAGRSTNVISLGNLEKQSGDALNARKTYQDAGGDIRTYEGGELNNTDLVVDALLGIGSERKLQGRFAEVVSAMNRSHAPIFALDQPSGIDTDRGTILGIAVKADATLTFIGVKRGLLTSQAVDFVGQLYLADLDVSSRARNQVEVDAYRLNERVCRTLVPSRKRNTHKGEHGKLVVIGGTAGMTGAVQMAGFSALRCGAGLVRIASRGEFFSAHPELMVTHVRSASDLDDLLESSNVIAIGPGLGRDEGAQQFLGKVLDFRKKNQRLVLDADALACLGDQSIVLYGAVLTPHPGEASMLLSCSVNDVQQDRFAAAQEIARRYSCTCVLKGAGTVVSDGENAFLSVYGGPEMASAGTGDVLTGIIAALLGQGLETLDAANLGVFLHGMAGERVAYRYGVGLMASDLSEQVPVILRQLRSL